MLKCRRVEPPIKLIALWPKTISALTSVTSAWNKTFTMKWYLSHLVSFQYNLVPHYICISFILYPFFAVLFGAALLNSILQLKAGRSWFCLSSCSQDCGLPALLDFHISAWIPNKYILRIYLHSFSDKKKKKGGTKNIFSHYFIYTNCRFVNDHVVTTTFH